MKKMNDKLRLLELWVFLEICCIRYPCYFSSYFSRDRARGVSPIPLVPCTKTRVLPEYLRCPHQVKILQGSPGATDAKKHMDEYGCISGWTFGRIWPLHPGTPWNSRPLILLNVLDYLPSLLPRGASIVYQTQGASCHRS